MSRKMDVASTHRGAGLALQVITPTYRREVLLGRFLRRIRRQTYRNWKLIVVHDGPNPSIAAMVGKASALDPRIEYTQLPERTNDTGVSPRHEGVRHAIATGGIDYCLFWDDDNLYTADAIERITAAVEAHGRPDLLLVSMKYRGKVLPPPGVAVASLAPGQVDSGCLVIRPSFALGAYEELARWRVRNPGANLYTSDYMVFDFIRGMVPPPRIEYAGGAPVGFHDGLRWGPYIRLLLGIPPLGLRKRF